MIRLDVHTHSGASGHGSNDTINEMARRASDLGLSILGITDHGPATKGSCTPSYFRSLALAPRKRFGVRILYGAELNILNHGLLDLPDEILSRLDFASAGMHAKCRRSDGITKNTAAYIKAMESPYVKIICHCDDPSFPVDYRTLAAAASENHVLLEINNVSLSPSGYRGDTRENNRLLLHCCLDLRHPILLGSDSHGAAHIGDVACAEAFVTAHRFPQEQILNYNPDRFLDYLLS